MVYCILHKMCKLRIGCVNEQYMDGQDLCKILSQCAIYEQDLCKIVFLSPMRNIVLISPMRKICTRLYLFPQCAIYVQNLHQIVLLSPMCNIQPESTVRISAWELPFLCHPMRSYDVLRKVL